MRRQRERRAFVGVCRIMKKHINYILVLVVGFVIGVLCRPDHIREVTKMVTKVDTLVIRDTHVIEKPILVERKVTDTMLIAVNDTTIVNDTVFVALPRESRIYKGEEYLAEISGYKPSLDRLEVYPKTVVISKTETTTKRNSLALGMEVAYSTIPYIPIYLEYGRMLHPNLEIYGKIFYDMPRFNVGVGVGVRASVGW